MTDEPKRPPSQAKKPTSKRRPGNDPIRNAILEHYRQLNSVQLHYDKQLWLVPGLAFGILSVMYGAAYSKELTSGVIKMAILVLSNLVYFGLFLKIINELAYQAKNSVLLRACREYLGIDKALESHVGKTSETRPKWTRIYENINAPKYIILIMAVTQLFLLWNLIHECVAFREIRQDAGGSNDSPAPIVVVAPANGDSPAPPTPANIQAPTATIPLSSPTHQPQPTLSHPDAPTPPPVNL